ncbi:MAG: trypsin-like peptidase domain-containing protein, partial [Actinomycetota bacterium]
MTVAASPVESSTPTPTPSSSPGRVFDRVRSGVVRLHTLTCDGGVSGSGLLVAPDLVLTVAHVVEGSDGVFSVRTDDQLAEGRVVAYERDHELALIRL